jgi:hypothetical protein
MADEREAEVVWLVNPRTGEHVALTYLDSPTAPWLKEVRTDARVFAGQPVVGGQRCGRNGLHVRADELMSGGFVPVPFSRSVSAVDAGLTALSPWREWLELASQPQRLGERWASWGAPAERTARLVRSLTSVEVQLDGCALTFGTGAGERFLFMSQPLAPERLATLPPGLHPFFRAHGRLELEADDVELVLGWNAVDPEQAELMVEAFEPGTTVIGSVSDGELLATPSGELIHVDTDGEERREPLASGLLRFLERALA